MKNIVVRRDFVVSPGPAADAPAHVLGAWLLIYGLCASDGVESPRLTSARAWDDFRWYQRAGVKVAQVEEVVAAGLARWDGDDLVLEGWDDGALRELKARRGAAAIATQAAARRPQRNQDGAQARNQASVRRGVKSPKRIG